MDRLARQLQRANRHIGRHPVALAAAMLLALGGFGGAAVAVAPATLLNGPIAQRLLTEELVPEGLQSQSEQLASHELVLVRSELTRAGDTAEALLQRMGVLDADAAWRPRKGPRKHGL